MPDKIMRDEMGRVIGILTVGGPDHKINCGDGAYITFEMHNYCGPVVLGKRGDPIKQPGPRHRFWVAVTQWVKQGKRLTPEGKCIWRHDDKPITKHLGGKHYQVVKWVPQEDIS